MSYGESDHYGWADRATWQGRASDVIRGHLTRYYTDENGRTRWNIESREGLRYQNVELLHYAGFMSAPKVGESAEIMIFDVNGDRGQLVGIPIGDSEKRQKIPEGWAAFGTPDKPEHHVRWDDEGNMHVRAPGKKVTIHESAEAVVNAATSITLNAPTIFINGNIVHVGNNTQTGIHIDSLGDHTP